MVLDVIGKVVVVVPVTDPAQFSVAVGAVIEATLHCPVTAAKVVASATGAVTSFIVTAWVWVEVLVPSV